VAKTAGSRGALSLIRRPEPIPGPGEIRIRILAAGLCGTDLEVYDWSPPIAAVMGASLPRVIGHEFAGRVEELGSGVDPELSGTRVAVESHHACGSCANCRTGRGHVCERLRYVGFHFDGGFADSAVIPAEIARRVPDAIDDVSAAIMEPFGLAVRAIDTGGGVAGRSLLVTGCGALGVMTALVARARGAASVLLAEQDRSRIELARRLTERDGPQEIVDVGREDLARVIDERTGGRGVDIWIDYTGSQAILDVGLAGLAKGGQARLLGVYGAPVTVDLTRAMLRELQLQPIHGRLLEESWQSAIELLEHRTVDLRPLVTGVFPLEEYEEAFRAARERDGLKVILQP
jgi:threonine 3-dehydrogenase